MGVFYLSGIILSAWIVIIVLHYPGIWQRAMLLRPIDRILYFPQAHMAQDLGPLMNSCVIDGCTILIPGGDPKELFRRRIPFIRYPWKRYLIKWLNENNAKITYFLVEPSESAIKELEKLHTQWKGFTLCLVRTLDEIEDEDDRKLLESMRTFHTVLLKNEAGDHRMMWIEGCHPPGSKVAYDCEFVPPPIAKNDPRFDIYWKTLKRVEKEFGEERIP